MMTLKVLILMSDTGGGHCSAAKAIAEAMVCFQPVERKIEIISALCFRQPFSSSKALQYSNHSYVAMPNSLESLCRWSSC